MKIKPYQMDDSQKHWDYNFKIGKKTYNASVRLEDGLLYLDLDPEPQDTYIEKAICEQCNKLKPVFHKEPCGGGCYDRFCSQKCLDKYINDGGK